MKKRVLITVLTYPCPSEKYIETVCTAGITDDGQWIRLYPIKLRLLKNVKLQKYHWYDFDVDKRAANKDSRKETSGLQVNSALFKNNTVKLRISGSYFEIPISLCESHFHTVKFTFHFYWIFRRSFITILVQRKVMSTSRRGYEEEEKGIKQNGMGNNRTH